MEDRRISISPVRFSSSCRQKLTASDSVVKLLSSADTVTFDCVDNAVFVEYSITWLRDLALFSINWLSKLGITHN